MHFITFSFSLSLSLSLPLYLSFHLSHLIYQRWRDTITSTFNCWIMNHYSSSTSPASIPLFPSGPDYVIYFFQMDTICTTRTAPAWMHQSSANRANWATVLMRFTSNWTLFLLPIVQHYLCDIRVTLCKERCYMTVIAPLLVRVWSFASVRFGLSWISGVQIRESAITISNW